MSTSLFLDIPIELRSQITAYVVFDDLTSLTQRAAAALLHVNRKLRHEYMDTLANDKNITFYVLYHDTAIWDVVGNGTKKLQILMRSAFTDLFHLNSLASAQRFCQSGVGTTGHHKDRERGILAVAEGGVMSQRYWMWEAGG